MVKEVRLKGSSRQFSQSEQGLVHSSINWAKMIDICQIYGMYDSTPDLVYLVDKLLFPSLFKNHYKAIP